jgi:hypothetical protein
MNTSVFPVFWQLPHSSCIIKHGFKKRWCTMRQDPQKVISDIKYRKPGAGALLAQSPFVFLVAAQIEK